MSQSQVNYTAKGVCANGGGCGGDPTSNSSTVLEKEGLNERKMKLTPMEFRVTQERQTERPFSNKYNKHWETGSYNCIVCNTELFTSDTKFESKSGWPAFSNVVDAKRVKLTPDLSHVGANLLLLVAKPDLARTEVSCANCNAHLGHLFKDGPKPTGLRYCINSSSLVFFPSGDEEGSTAATPNNKSEVEQPPNRVEANSATTTKTNSNTTVQSCTTPGENKDLTNTTTPSPLNRTPCPNPGSSSAKICFFQSATPLSRKSGTPNGKNLMVTSNSSGSLGSKTRWTDNNNSNNNNSLVRRRISLFSSMTPIETISSPPKLFILRETTL